MPQTQIILGREAGSDQGAFLLGEACLGQKSSYSGCHFWTQGLDLGALGVQPSWESLVDLWSLLSRWSLWKFLLNYLILGKSSWESLCLLGLNPWSPLSPLLSSKRPSPPYLSCFLLSRKSLSPPRSLPHCCLSLLLWGGLSYFPPRESLRSPLSKRSFLSYMSFLSSRSYLGRLSSLSPLSPRSPRSPRSPLSPLFSQGFLLSPLGLYRAQSSSNPSIGYLSGLNLLQGAFPPLEKRLSSFSMRWQPFCPAGVVSAFYADFLVNFFCEGSNYAYSSKEKSLPNVSSSFGVVTTFFLGLAFSQATASTLLNRSQNSFTQSCSSPSAIPSFLGCFSFPSFPFSP